ncbi:MAG: DNA recombination protein RmuC [Mariniphaga sp.]|nr:DNA recombination protein RmuC [Mariniphaga sp.]
MENQLLIALIAINLLVTLLLLFLRNKKNPELSGRIDSLDKSLLKIEAALREDFRINREENSNIAKENRAELNATLKDFQRELAFTLKETTNQSRSESVLQRETLINSFKGFQETFEKNVESFNQLQREKFAFLGEEQKRMVDSTEKRLEEIRVTVDEKLQKTLNERLGQSFELVVRQLENVQKGLGEMQTLAQDVGGLKRVLSNVKMRGSIGEVQLAMLLEQILAPGQYEANVKTKAGSAEIVEFAIKLPGRDENNSVVWLPVDAKFPKDIYEQLQAAHDTGDLLKIDAAQKLLEQTIKKMAKDIHDKYIDPPNTTDFGIMFLPFEGIYAEVVRRASLLDELQRTYKIVVTGPTTLAAILNSLQMGFKTLAIQQRSGEVWKILGAVKKEFELFGGLVEKAQGNIQTGLNQLDDVLGKRTRAIQRKLKSVEVLESIDNKSILPELLDDEVTED